MLLQWYMYNVSSALFPSSYDTWIYGKWRNSLAFVKFFRLNISSNTFTSIFIWASQWEKVWSLLEMDCKIEQFKNQNDHVLFRECRIAEWTVTFITTNKRQDNGQLPFDVKLGQVLHIIVATKWKKLPHVWFQKKGRRPEGRKMESFYAAGVQVVRIRPETCLSNLLGDIESQNVSIESTSQL